MEWKDSETLKNLMHAFAGESQARNKYTFYAQKARQEGLEALAAVWEDTARNEQAHAKAWFNLMHGGGIPDSLQNLRDSAEGEDFECRKMYPAFAETAQKEGFSGVAARMQAVAAIEGRHRDRFLDLHERFSEDRLFRGSDQTLWICRNCGFILQTATPPEKCPVCLHPKGWFEPAASYRF